MRALVCLVVVCCACTSNGGGDDDDGGAFCGDGVCNGSENASSCSTDCRASPCSTSPDSCAGETICIAGNCEAAFPRVYQIRNIAVAVPTTNPFTGETWDAGGGAPDMFLGDANANPISNVVQDQFSATFAGPFEATLVAGARFQLDIWDEDLTTNDPVFSCVANPVSAQLLRGRSFACNASGITLSSSITPK